MARALKSPNYKSKVSFLRPQFTFKYYPAGSLIPNRDDGQTATIPFLYAQVTIPERTSHIEIHLLDDIESGNYPHYKWWSLINKEIMGTYSSMADGFNIHLVPNIITGASNIYTVLLPGGLYDIYFYKRTVDGEALSEVYNGKTGYALCSQIIDE